MTADVRGAAGTGDEDLTRFRDEAIALLQNDGDGYSHIEATLIANALLPVVARDRARREQKITEDKPGSALTLGCRPCKECAEKLAKITEMRALHTFDGINGCDKCGEAVAVRDGAHPGRREEEMSACISRAGEFSSHIYSGLTIPESFTCARCAVLAEDEIFEALVAALARVEKVRALADEWEQGFARTRGEPRIDVMIAELRRLLDAPLPSVDGTGDNDATQ